MERFCGNTPFFDKQLWNSTDCLDFTPCFQNVVFYIAPSVFLMLVSPCRLYHLYHSQREGLTHHWLATLQTVLSVCLACLPLAELFRFLHKSAVSNQAYPVDLLTGVTRVLAMVIAATIIQMERRKSGRSFGGLFVYWLMLVVCGALILYSKILRTYIQGNVMDMFSLVTFAIHYALVILQLVLSFIPNPTTEQYKEHPHPEMATNYLSRLTFWWFTRTVIAGYRRALKVSDLPELHDADKVANSLSKFEQEWARKTDRLTRRSIERRETCFPGHVPDINHPSSQELSEITRSETRNDACPPMEDQPFIPSNTPPGHEEPSLVRCLVKIYLAPILSCASFKLAQDICLFASPILLKLIIQFVQSNDEPYWRGFIYAFSIFCVINARSLLLNQYNMKSAHIGMRMKALISAAVYNKSLRLKLHTAEIPTARKKEKVGEADGNNGNMKKNVGKILNIMESDAQKFMDIMAQINNIWSGPLQLALSLFLLWQILGPSVLAGLAVIIVLIPVNVVIGKIMKRLQREQMKAKDLRVKWMSEILHGMKVLKFYAWEESFQSHISEVRAKELKAIRKKGYADAINQFCWQCAPVFVACATFATYSLSDEDNVLDAEKAFVSLALFDIMREPMLALPKLITHLAQIRVSIKRLQDFLSLEEYGNNEIDRMPNDDAAVKLDAATFTWKEPNVRPSLTNISLKIGHGQLAAVVGPFGSGKSSLFSALLGDMRKVAGSASISGKIAYVAQEAWMQSATLRDNVLFGMKYEEDRYKQVLDICQLTPDLRRLQRGDMAEIGEKGKNLSGGQKQRVSLARAIYSRADIYLLDDPLSAVDAHVGRRLFDDIIGPKGYLSGKTRILVTHGTCFLSQADVIYVLEDGRIAESGSPQQLVDQGRAFSAILKTDYLKANNNSSESDVIAIADLLRHISLAESNDIECHDREQVESLNSTAGDDSKLKDDECAKLIEDEKSEIGNIKLSVLKAYMKAAGWPLSISVLMFYLLEYCCILSGAYWLSRWSDDPKAANDTHTKYLYLGGYVSLGAGTALFSGLASLMLVFASWNASKNLHSDLLDNILRCPMAQFETKQSGTILNRFAKDISTLDSYIPYNIMMFVLCVLIVLSTLIAVSISNPWFPLFAVPLIIFYVMIQRFHIRTSRQLKRIESTNLSPVYNHITESLQGVTTIRAFDKQEDFINESQARIDEHQRACYLGIISTRWLSVGLEFVGCCIILTCVLLAVLTRNSNNSILTAGLAGLAISYALNVTRILSALVRTMSDLESHAVSVERIKEYTELSNEAERIIDTNRTPSGWPSNGCIEFDKYSVCYRAGLDPVLKGISFEIKGGEKVGVVGRTGAGKSSLTLAIFRILERSQGAIYIDGVEIGTIGLHDLRQSLTIIPQDPVIFSGTLKMNLDPFSKFTDEQIWRALEQAGLGRFSKSLKYGLNHFCSEGGSNLSAGEKQLICLARALLRHTKVLILDEATAAVDLKTDKIIQDTIKSAFSDCTVLTIAHRLNTVMDSDRIMVVDDGIIAEFASPDELLSDPNSLFYSLAQEANIAEK